MARAFRQVRRAGRPGANRIQKLVHVCYSIAGQTPDRTIARERILPPSQAAPGRHGGGPGASAASMADRRPTGLLPLGRPTGRRSSFVLHARYERKEPAAEAALARLAGIRPPCQTPHAVRIRRSAGRETTSPPSCTRRFSTWTPAWRSGYLTAPIGALLRCCIPARTAPLGRSRRRGGAGREECGAPV